MSDNKNNFQEDIYDMIRDAVDKMDLEGLSDQLSKTFKQAGIEIRDAFSQAGQEMSENFKKNTKRAFGTGYKNARFGYERNRYRYEDHKEGSIYENSHIIDPKEDPQLPMAGSLNKLPGQYSGPLKTIFGALGMSCFGPVSLMFYLAALGSHALRMVYFFTGTLFLPFALGSAYAIAKGILSIQRVNRIKGYLSLWKGKPYIMMEDLHAHTQIGIEQIKKDVRFLMNNQALYYGRLDKTGNCLMLTEDAYQQYEETMQAQEEQRREEEAKKQAEDRDRFEGASEEEKEFYEFKKHSGEYYNELIHYQEIIDDKTMSMKLDEFIGLYSRLLVAVNEDRSKMKNISKLIDIYIPSVLKLLSVYDDMEDKSFETQNLAGTKLEIEKSMDMMNQAMNKMYDDLFLDTAMDVSADVKVLEMLLKKEGWL